MWLDCDCWKRNGAKLGVLKMKRSQTEIAKNEIGQTRMAKNEIGLDWDYQK